MICEACRDRRHGECRGGTWCDCQHKPPARKRPGERAAVEAHAVHPGETSQIGQIDQTRPSRPSDEDEPAGPDAGDGSEPGINWLRQG